MLQPLDVLVPRGPMLALLLTTLGMLACSRAATPAPDAAARSRVHGGDAESVEARIDLGAVPLGGLDTPYKADDPPLTGDRSALDLKSLVRSTLDYSITMDTQALASLDEPGAEALLLHLAADPRWRVYEDNGVVLAARRAHQPEGWTVPSSGYHPGPDGPWRVVLRFGELEPGHPWKASPFVTQIDADDGFVKLEGFVPEASVYDGRVITALRIEAPQVALDIYETGHEDGRPRTGDALGEIPPTVSNAVMLGDRLRNNGHEALLMPPGEPTAATSSMQLQAPGTGELSWSARVNPQESGWVWLRLLKDGRVWEEVAISGSTRERVGFSHDPARAFLAQSRFPVPSGESFGATAEVWFLPDLGDARVLQSAPITVPLR